MESNSTPKTEGKLISVGHLLSPLMCLPDSRKRCGIRYRLEMSLLLFILAKLCGQNKPSGIADGVQERRSSLIEVLELKRKSLPYHSTYRRILSDVVNGEELEQIIADYLTQGKKW